MDNEELLALTGDIDILIERYEKSAKKRIRKAGLQEIETVATSLHLSPLMAADFMIKTAASASMTHEELFNSYMSQGMEVKSDSIRNQKAKEEIPQDKLFDINCDTVDPDKSFWDPGKPEYGKHPEEKFQKGASWRLTNPVKVKVESDIFGWLNDAYEKKGQSNSFENCFNCDLSFSIDTVYPAIELAWELDKILQQVKDFIKLFKKNLDPTLMFNQLCKFKLFIKKNYLCFANLQNLSLMIPALFAKYSIDLANLSLDWNWILGGVLKTIFTFVTNFLENIRALIVPFINCYIGAVNNTFGLIKSIVKALNKSVQTINDAIERGVDSIAKAGMLLADIFHDTESDKTNESIVKAKTEIAKAEQTLKNARKALTSLEILKSERLEFLAKLELAEEELKRLKDINNILEWIINREKRFKRNAEQFNLTQVEFENAFIAYIKENSHFNNESRSESIKTTEDIFNFINERLNFIASKRKTAENTLNSTTDDWSYRNQTKSWEETKGKSQKTIAQKTKEVSKAEAKLEKLAKESLYERYSQRRKDVSGFYKPTNSIEKLIQGSGGTYKSGWFSSAGSINDNISESVNEYSKSLSEWCSTRMGLNIENEYVRNEYWSKDFNSYLNSKEAIAVSGIDSTRDILVNPAENLKTFINDFIGNAVNAVRSLSFLFERGAALELKILGEILQLAHLIRLIVLIKKLLDEGISSCEDLNGSKENQALLKKSIEELNSNLEVDIVEEENADLNSESKVAKISTRNNKNQHLLNFSDCSELSFHMGERNPNLEDIYNNLKTALIK